MDKLAPAISWIKDYGFWLANGLLLLLMIGIWHLQTGSLNQAREANTSKINSQFRTAEGVSRKTPGDTPDVRVHPNGKTKDGMQAELKETVDSIIAAWRLQVERQKQLLVFPSVIENQKFDEVFAQYNPPETFPVKYADIKTIDALLSLYRSKIKDHMINICGKNGVRTNWCWDPENYDQEPIQGGANNVERASPVQEGDVARFAVLWSVVNQNLWHDKLTVFQDRDDHNKETNDPTPLQCYMLQQDLWVLEAMFNVIAKLNGDSTATDTSAIKQIDHIGIGREGYAQQVELHAVDARFGPETDADKKPDTGITAGRGRGRTENIAGGGTGGRNSDYKLYFSEEDQTDNNNAARSGNREEKGERESNLPPFHNMYVDTKFEPISSEQVLAVVKGDQLSETNLELLIAKRLPVRIGLKMDERKIPDFMAACINSPFSFEIQQVRINRHTPGGETIKLGGGISSKLGSDRNEGRSEDRFDNVAPIETRVNYDVNVEFFGIIKIYNPVRADLIRKAAGIETEEGDGNSLDAAANRSDSAGVRSAG